MAFHGMNEPLMDFVGDWLDDGSVVSARGYRAAGVACGLKKDHGLDLAMLVSDQPADAAGVFTLNKVKGHSLVLTMQRIDSGPFRAVVVNSGNANACVGPQGYEDAREWAEAVGAAIGCAPEAVLTGSTGVIGKRLDLEALRRGTTEAAGRLAATVEAGHAAERAIMTTDRVPKEAALRFAVGDVGVTIGGMAKGSGMIHPDMATMIGIITTDCVIDPSLIYRALSRAVDQSFNRVSVDGDTSVCDMVLLLANGAAGNASIESGSAEEMKFIQALTQVCRRLARLVAKDGEGATKLIEVCVEGARTASDANRIAQAVARSPLVKTAIFGEDANWGRILTAIGYSGAEFDPNGCDIAMGNLPVCQSGNALIFDESRAKEILKADEIEIRIRLRDGEASDFYWTCDFSYDYVRINGSYRT